MKPIKPRSAFAAAVHVLEAPTLSRYVDGKIDYERERISFDSLFARRREMSDGEKMLIDCAFAFWNGGWDTQATLSGILRQLDDDTYTRVVEAMLALRPLKTEEV